LDEEGNAAPSDQPGAEAVFVRHLAPVREPASAAFFPMGRAEGGRFGPGNPGRPKGSRNRMTNQLAMALLDDFWRNEEAIIEKARRWFFPQYVQLISRFLPRETQAPAPDFASYSPQERAALVQAARGALAQIERGEAELDDLLAVLQHDPATVPPDSDDISNSP
jgi:hypothetical protein